MIWSDETFRILGYEPTVNPTLDFVFKRVHPEDLSLVQRVIENAKAGESLDFEHRLLLPDGSVKHVHVIARPLTSDSSEVEFVGTVMDVTARKKALEEIKALKDELYKENIVLRQKSESTSMFEEVLGTSSALQNGTGVGRESCTDRFDCFNRGRNGDWKGVDRAGDSQEIETRRGVRSLE